MGTAVTFRARDGWPAAAMVAGFVLVASAARAGPRRAGTVATGQPASGGRPPQVTAHPQSDLPHQLRPQHHLHLGLPWPLIQTVIEAGLLLAAIGLVVLVVPLLPTLAARRRSRRQPRVAEPAPDDLARRVADTLRQTMAQVAHGQVRDGVILCWRRLEEIAEAAGYPRLAADTSTELAGRLLASLPLSPAPLNRLAALYREARFSSHPIGSEAVEQARTDLAQLRSELDGAGRPAGAGHG